MQDSMMQKDVAVKIVTMPNVEENEIDLWPELKHEHIVPLIDAFCLDQLEVAIFMMPVLKTNLHDVLCKSHFLSHEESFGQVKVWLYEILSAFDYLSENSLCHLDIKVDNVLISDSNVAMLCDFSFLNMDIGALTRNDLGLPYIYRPPEGCLTIEENTKPILGFAYDMWGYGMMAIEILTSFVIAREKIDCKCWINDVYPLLFNTLKENKFHNLLKKTFPNSNIDRKEAKDALNFVQCFAFHSPKERVRPKKGMMHTFLGKDNWICSQNDPMWIVEDYFNSDTVSYGGSSGDLFMDLSTFKDDYTFESPDNKQSDFSNYFQNVLTDTEPHFNYQTESKLSLPLGFSASNPDLVVRKPTESGRSFSFPTTDPKDFEDVKVMFSEENKENVSEADDATKSGGSKLGKDYFNTDTESYGGSSGDSFIALSSFEDDNTFDSPANKHRDLNDYFQNILTDTKPNFNDQIEPQSKLSLTLGCSASDTDLVFEVRKPSESGRSFSFPTTDHLGWNVNFCAESASGDQFDLLSSRCDPLMSEGNDHGHDHDQPGSSEPDEYYEYRSKYSGLLSPKDFEIEGVMISEENKKKDSETNDAPKSGFRKLGNMSDFRKKYSRVKSRKDFEVGGVMISEENKKNDSEIDDAPKSGGRKLGKDKKKRMDFIPWLRNKFRKLGNFLKNRSRRERKI